MASDNKRFFSLPFYAGSILGGGLLLFSAASSFSQAAPADTSAKAVTAETSVKTVAADTARAKVLSGADTGRAGVTRTDTAAASAPAPAPAAATSDTAVVVTPDTAAAASTAPATTQGRKRKPAIVRETTVNTIDEMKGRYRSPRKALFMSLVLPGLGQAYVGQSTFNYVRGGLYLLTDVALGYGWYHYTVVKHDEQVKKYERFADENWRLSRYEGRIQTFDFTSEAQGQFGPSNPNRDVFCDAVVPGSDADNREACKEPGRGGSITPAYQNYLAVYREADNATAAEVHQKRAQYPGRESFYELIGSYDEFRAGWSDIPQAQWNDSTAVSAQQREYREMRGKANDYSRMQAYFLGGMVLTHLVSAIDAGLAAHFHNKQLYTTDIGFWDRLRLDSFISMSGDRPKSHVTASVTF